MVDSCPDEIAKIYAYGYFKKISYDTLDIPILTSKIYQMLKNLK